MSAAGRKLSAVIIAKDEAERLGRCVAALEPVADEVLVVDGGSADGTVQLARRLGCRVVENPWPGYGRQRNFGAEHASNDWVLFVDADEVVGPDLAEALSAWKLATTEPTAAYSVRRVGDFMGRWLETRAERLVRLYDRRQCRVSDVTVHEVVETNGHPVGQLPGTLWHYGFRSVGDHVARFDRYATLEAEAAWQSGRRFSWRRLCLRPPARLIQALFVQRLFRQGLPGFAACALLVQLEILRELKLRELEWRHDGAPHSEI